ncbi:PPOX class F420-dependent oxidoreductase [Tomitella fengzijianii]|uniref:PPOX class F420-dependent oxidoreductase n=1 Tax=Tomitella fengzijianii TaxID=2597660 RepID=A0A516X2R0_9ACTN|nr:PPOX class F420-dependent oxidoreductase [Tomitella fengzijianii]QDQ97369.1 PPOX class F420-dependent oxidoreductase [Tomitella fengzijianii]
MPIGPEQLHPSALDFLADRHLATLATQRADGSPHVVAVGFTWDAAAGLARVITNAGSQKARNAQRGGRAALTQIDGARWLTLEGSARVSDDPDDVARAVELYAGRYRQPRPNPARVVVEVAVDRVLGLQTLLRAPA